MALERDKLKARDRILAAASRIFAEQGVKGATTREIARTAEVNETTLFRHFPNKEALLQAVVCKSAAEIVEALSGPGMGNHDLRKDLTYYAAVYHDVLGRNEPMIRMFIGSPHHHAEARQICFQAWQPVKDKLIAYLAQAKADGQVRPEVDAVQAVDIFKSLFIGHLFRRGMAPLEYSSEAYLASALEIFIQGISVRPQAEESAL